MRSILRFFFAPHGAKAQPGAAAAAAAAAEAAEAAAAASSPFAYRTWIHPAPATAGRAAGAMDASSSGGAPFAAAAGAAGGADAAAGMAVGDAALLPQKNRHRDAFDEALKELNTMPWVQAELDKLQQQQQQQQQGVSAISTELLFEMANSAFQNDTGSTGEGRRRATQLWAEAARRGNRDAAYSLAVQLIQSKPPSSSQAAAPSAAGSPGAKSRPPTPAQQPADAPVDTIAVAAVLAAIGAHADAAAAPAGMTRAGATAPKASAASEAVALAAAAAAAQAAAVAATASSADTTSPSQLARGGVTLLERLVQQGHSQARYALAQALQRGVVVEDRGSKVQVLAQDSPRAYHLFVASYKDGIVPAIHAAASMLAEGQGTQKDLAKALRMFEAASYVGDPLSKLTLASYFLRGVPGVVARDEKRAFTLHKDAAERGAVLAMFNLAHHYLQGNGTARDLPKSAEWFARAAEAGMPEAAVNLSTAFRMGVGVAPDPARARAVLQPFLAGSEAAREQLKVLDEDQREASAAAAAAAAKPSA